MLMYEGEDRLRDLKAQLRGMFAKRNAEDPCLKADPNRQVRLCDLLLGLECWFRVALSPDQLSFFAGHSGCWWYHGRLQRG